MAQGDPRVVVVIGFGEPDGGDAAVGYDVISLLQRMGDLGCELRVIEGNPPSGFLDDIASDSLVIFIDSVMNGAAPGTIHCLKLPSTSARTRHLHSEDLPLGKAENRQPVKAPRMFLIGVEVPDAAISEEPSDSVGKAVTEIVRNFARYLKLARDLTA